MKATRITGEWSVSRRECRAKIYIVDEAHQITKDAANAPLKTIEDPPPYAKFILATTESRKDAR